MVLPNLTSWWFSSSQAVKLTKGIYPINQDFFSFLLLLLSSPLLSWFPSHFMGILHIYICWINKFINQLDNMYIVCIYIYIHIHTRETWPVYMTASSIRHDSCLDLTKHQGKITGRSNPYLRNGMAVTSIKWMCPCDQNFALCICHPSYSI